MDIPALSMALNQANLTQDASPSVMKMAIDTVKTNGANMTEKFSRIGTECEDSCCIGWRVDIDH